MNSNLAEVGKPTRWPPGKSGNPAGKPPGTRTAFSQGFIRDFALVWAEEGLEAVRKVAKKSPEAFLAIAARICPNDVRLTLEQAIPGGMSLEDYLLMREVIGAIRKGMPEADQIAARCSISACVPYCIPRSTAEDVVPHIGHGIRIIEKEEIVIAALLRHEQVSM